MLDLLRGWNERSFLGWRPLGVRVATYALVWTILVTVLRRDGLPEVPALTSWLLTTLLFAGWLALLARLTDWLGAFSWKAALAGWSRLLPLLLTVPLIDALLHPLIGLDLPSWWIAPKGILSWVFLGRTGQGFVSPGLTLLILFSAGFFLYLLRKRGLPWSRTGFGVASALILPWLILAFPSLSAWSRLSSYGTTLAPASQVVAQAFERAWSRSYWSFGFERFLDLSVTAPDMERRLLLTVFAWIGLVCLLAPSLWPRKRFTEQAKTLFRHATLVLIPLLGGYLMQFSNVAGRTPLAFIAFLLVLFYEVALLTAFLRSNTEEDPDSQERWLLVPLILIGGWLLGWGSLLAVVGFIALSSKAELAETWSGRSSWQAARFALIFFWGSWLAAGVSLLFWRPAFLLGVFGLWQTVLLVWNGIPLLHADRAVEWWGKARSARDFQLSLAVIWVVSLLCLWWGVGVWRFVWGVLVLGVLGPAVTAFFAADSRSRQVVLAAFPLLLGLLLHAGVFLP